MKAMVTEWLLLPGSAGIWYHQWMVKPTISDLWEKVRLTELCVAQPPAAMKNSATITATQKLIITNWGSPLWSLENMEINEWIYILTSSRDRHLEMQLLLIEYYAGHLLTLCTVSFEVCIIFSSKLLNMLFPQDILYVSGLISFLTMFDLSLVHFSCHNKEYLVEHLIHKPYQCSIQLVLQGAAPSKCLIEGTTMFHATHLAMK